MKTWFRDSSSVEELKQHAQSRLYPRLTNPNYLVLRKRRELFEKWLAGVPGRRLKVLDVGGRVQPYRALVEERVSRYIAVDVRSSRVVDIVGMGEQLPLAADVFDLVFCTQVLEFATDPRSAVAEIHRVLKPGGVLLMSVSTIFPRAADEEYWRFQPAALRMLLANFSKFEIVPEGNSITGFLRTVAVFTVSAGKIELVRRALGYLVALPLNLLGLVLEPLALTRNTQFTANYSAMAQK